MKYRILPRRVTLLIFDDSNYINYIASCQININNKHGTIDSLIGKDFYKFLAENGYSVFKDLGLEEVCVAVTPAHCKLIIRKLGKILNVEEVEEAESMKEDDELRLCWLRITEKKPA